MPCYAAHADTEPVDVGDSTQVALRVEDTDFITTITEAARKRAAHRIRAFGIAMAAYCLLLALRHGRGMFD